MRWMSAKLVKDLQVLHHPVQKYSDKNWEYMYDRAQSFADGRKRIFNRTDLKINLSGL